MINVLYDMLEDFEKRRKKIGCYVNDEYVMYEKYESAIKQAILELENKQ